MKRIRFDFCAKEMINACGIEISFEPQRFLIHDEDVFNINVCVNKANGDVVFMRDGVFFDGGLGISIENGIGMNARIFLAELKKQIGFIPKHNGGQFPMNFDDEIQETFDEFRNDMLRLYQFIVGANEMDHFSLDEFAELCKYRETHDFKEVYCIRDFDEHVEYMKKNGISTYSEIMKETEESGMYCVVGNRVVEFRYGGGIDAGLLKLEMFGNIGGKISEIKD